MWQDANSKSRQSTTTALKCFKIKEGRLWQCVCSMDEVCWGWCDTALAAIWKNPQAQALNSKIKLGECSNDSHPVVPFAGTLLAPFPGWQHQYMLRALLPWNGWCGPPNSGIMGPLWEKLASSVSRNSYFNSTLSWSCRSLFPIAQEIYFSPKFWCAWISECHVKSGLDLRPLEIDIWDPWR